MSTILVILSLWLHNLATAITVGYFLLMSLVFVPMVTGGHVGCPFLYHMSRRVRPWLGLSMLVFFGTGMLFLVVDDNYLGFARFENAWSLLMLVKHILVVAVIGLYALLEVTLRRIGEGQVAGEETAARGLRRCTLVAFGLSLTGAFTLLLTAAAQAL